VNLAADEGVDRPVVERLRQDGHDVVYVAELSPSLPDDEVLQQWPHPHSPTAVIPLQGSNYRIHPTACGRG
jgi:hypothetical protein